jgi:hypothetical protein
MLWGEVGRLPRSTGGALVSVGDAVKVEEEGRGCASRPSVWRRGKGTGRSGGGVLGASGEPVIADSSIVIVGARGLVGLGDGFGGAS